MADIEIKDLLKYKSKVKLTAGSKTLRTVWVRILGDYDLQLSYRLARIASSKRRSLLRTVGTVEYADEIAIIPEVNTREECIDLIKASKSNVFIGEGYANIDREDLPKMDEIAEEPDAPTLEEQEKLDALVKKQEQEYQQKIQNYLKDRQEALTAELNPKTDEEIYKMCQFEMSNILALQEFQSELITQKVFRATYLDEKCSKRAFTSIEDYRDSHTAIKNQLITAYNEVEISPDDIKN